MRERPTEALAWQYAFALESEGGAAVGEVDACELLQIIVRWAEARNLQVGGGYYPAEWDNEDDEMR